MKKPKDLIKLFDGNIAMAARELGVSRQAIYQWLSAGELTAHAFKQLHQWFRNQRKRVPPEWMP